MLQKKKKYFKSFILNRPVGPDVAVVTLRQEVIQRPFTKAISKCTYRGILKSPFRQNYISHPGIFISSLVSLVLSTS